MSEYCTQTVSLLTVIAMNIRPSGCTVAHKTIDRIDARPSVGTWRTRAFIDVCCKKKQQIRNILTL